MNRMTRVYSAAIVGTSALLLTACGSSSPSPAKAAAPDTPASSAVAPAPADVPTTAAAAPTKAPAGSGGAAPVGGVNSVTIKGESGGTFQFGGGGCIGGKSPSSKLVLTASPVGAGSAQGGLIVTFDGDGKVNLLLTNGDDQSNAVAWAGDTTVGETASRTLDTVKLVDLPVAQLMGAKGTASGFLKCESTDGLL
ncbi:hypothetical protein ACGF12_26775 [Kitasatospora sp. NPDC048296]|uniref:hypothetical protein n=1 Tax=Kitasatospora sp. NPDC048296 TaxID=3364048 RepID=UPI00371F8A7B